MNLSWGKGIAATDAWVGCLDGTLVSPETRRVTHLIGKRGLIFPRRYAVPFEHLRRWDNEGLYLDTSIAQVLRLTTLRHLDDEPGHIVLTSRTRLSLADGASLRLNGLRLSPEAPSITHLIAGYPGFGQPNIVLPLDGVRDLAGGLMTAAFGGSDLNSFPIYRPDEDIETDAWETLYTSEVISPVDLAGIGMRVVDGELELTGNVRTSSGVADAQRLARAVSGVSQINNRLVCDWELDIAVASIISKQLPDLSSGIVVHTQLGTVILEGAAPSTETKAALLQEVRSLPGARGIEDRIEVRTPATPQEAERAQPAEGGHRKEEPAAHVIPS